jgi:hypothetical protein
VTSQQNDCTRTARNASLLNLSSHKQPLPVQAACRPLPTDAETDKSQVFQEDDIINFWMDI